MRTWIISDTHFGHENIIAYCRRPFQNAEEMNKRLCELWKATVAEEDLVFHLGDVAMTMRKTDVATLLNSYTLPGRKILIRGNHDGWTDSWYLNNGFDAVCEGMVYKGVWLTHHPARELPKGAYLNVHGHLHNLDPTDEGFKANNPARWAGHEGGDLPFNQLYALENEHYRPVLWDSWVRKATWREMVESPGSISDMSGQ